MPVIEDRAAAIPELVPGPLCEAVFDALHRNPESAVALPSNAGTADPLGHDLQLALYCCYELHYRGLAGVDDGWEWNPDLLRLRAAMEAKFAGAVHANVERGSDAVADMNMLSHSPTTEVGASQFLCDTGSWSQMREYFAHRSIYHLKEADPHAWAIPRLTGAAKAGFVAVEYDEYGGGHADRMHQKLFADLLDAADMSSQYSFYLDQVSAETLATVNIMSLFGLHRKYRAAAVGHLAATEITSSPGSARLVEALRRMNAPASCTAFYSEHVEADAVHEQVVRHDVVGSLISSEPEQEPGIVFGMRAAAFVEDRLSKALVTAWSSGQSSLFSGAVL